MAFVVGYLVVSSAGLIMVFQIGANYISFKLYSCSRAELPPINGYDGGTNLW